MREVKYTAFLLVLLLAACNSPTSSFWDVEKQVITVDGSVFHVRVDGTQAQIIRVNPQWAPRLAAVAPRMVAAIEKVSGCKVRKLHGDQAMATAALNCGGALEPLPKSRSYKCALDDLHGDYADLTCDPVYPP